jgi:GTP-binding protein Era
VLDLLAKVERPKIVALNKIDRMKKARLLPEIERYAEAGNFEEIIPISALEGDGTERLLELLWERLPEGEPIFDPELLTVHTERFLVAELIREKVLAHTREELPFTTAVVIDDWEEEPGEGKSPGRVHIAASILVERSGQKKIVIGHRGQMVKTIGTEARMELEDFLARPVYLELQVRLEPGWRESAGILNELERGLEDALPEPLLRGERGSERG